MAEFEIHGKAPYREIAFWLNCGDFANDTNYPDRLPVGFSHTPPSGGQAKYAFTGDEDKISKMRLALEKMGHTEK